MVSGTGMKCIKYLLFIFNFLFLLAGLGLIIIGAIAQAEQSKIGHVSSAAILVLVIGGVVFLLSFFGCCGAIKENQCMLITFGVLMIIMFVLCIAAVIVAFVFKSHVKGLWEQPLLDSVKNFVPKQDSLQDWPELQFKEKCCGVFNYSEWLDNKYYKDQGPNEVPASCCGTHNETAACSVSQITNKSGCLDAIIMKIENAIVIVGAIVAAIAILQLLGIIFSFALANAIHKGYNVV